jgi:hypothetical protein
LEARGGFGPHRILLHGRGNVGIKDRQFISEGGN